MKKNLLLIMIASLFSTATFADTTVYGKANVAIQSSDKNVGGNFTEVVSNASRIGLKGGEDINGDLKVIYQFEYETKVDDGNNSNSQTFSQRNIYIGLQGSGGTAMIGMFDTPLKVSQEKVDLFNDMAGDLKSVLEGEVRAKNIIQYSTPSFNDVTVNLAYVNTEQDKVNSTNGYSASVTYATKNIYLALATDKNSKNATEQKTILDDTDIIRAVGRFTLGSVVLGAMWETYDNGLIDENGYLLSAQWNINENWAFKAQHVQSDMIQRGGKSTSIGADYKLSKATKLFGYYTIQEDERLNLLTNLVDNVARTDDQYVAIGVEFNF